MLNANTYVTEDKGIGGTIRNRWEDFYVEEIPEMLPDGWNPKSSSRKLKPWLEP